MERKIVFRALVVVAAAALFPCAAHKGYAYTPGKSLEVMDQQQKSAELDAAVALSRQLLSYDAASFRDPFQPYIRDESAGSSGNDYNQVDHTAELIAGYKVEGIIWGTKLPQAIINHKVLSVGDTLDGDVKVLEISKEGITLFCKSKNYKIAAPGLSQVDGNSKKGGNDVH